jgi:Cytochrome c7 and related cytochrome c/Class III cytochrome C family
MRAVAKKQLLHENLLLCTVLLGAFLVAASRPPGIAVTAQEPPAKDATPSTVKTPVANQPIPFSHKLHLSFDLKCQGCHPNPEPGDRMTLPSVGQCMECHRTIAKEKPAIQKLAEFAKDDQRIPWVRLYVVAGWVFWNHRSHLEAGMTCEMCHGDVSKMEVLTATTNVTTMAGCVECHRQKNAGTGCQYCHSGK